MTTSTTSKQFFNVSITGLDALEAELNRIMNVPGWSVIDMIATGDRIGVVYIDSNLLTEDSEDGPDSTELPN